MKKIEDKFSGSRKQIKSRTCKNANDLL